MIGIELDRPCSALMQLSLEAGLLLSVTADRVVRLVPPLIVTPTECDEIVSILTPVVRSFLEQA
jgi:acetylornithine aminotransferase